MRLKILWKNNQNMTHQLMDLVTGGAGFIGSHLVDRLLSEGRKVRVVDNMVSGHPRNLEQHKNNPNLEVITGDVANLELMQSACQGVDRVFHLAARADIVPSIENPLEYYRANVDGTFSVLEAARAHQVKKFIYIASSSCYGFPDVVPTHEKAGISPQYPYALTKYLGEELALHWHKVYKLPVVSLRFFNVYGPRARTSGTYGAVFGVFLAQLLANKPLTVVGDGEQRRDFTYVGDVVDAIVCAGSSNITGEIFNVGSGREPVTINRLVELLGAKEVVHIPKRPGEPDITCADVSKIKKMLSWQASVSIEDGVKVMLDHIDYWREAPVWTPETIADATSVWFKCLDAQTA
jgi:UDP-glucose 4-epimerase